jgi:hypothetical protein
MVLNVIAAVASGVAAGAAIFTVIYARLTVRDGRAAHSEEMAVRSDAFIAEIRMQRLVHASRLTDVLIAIARGAHDETLAGSVPVPSRRPSVIPSLQAQLRAELAVFYALGGPPLSSSDELESNAYGDMDDEPYQTARPDAVGRLAAKSLAELKQWIDRDGRLRVTLDEHHRLVVDGPS